MMINTEKVKALNPCADRFNNFTTNYPNFSGDLKTFLQLDNITYLDKVWVVTRLFTKKQNVMWSILCAESTLHFFEDVYPDDNRPRLAIEAAKNYIENPTMSAARSAAWSAESAESAAESAARSAARSAESAARSAESVAEKEQETKNLGFMLMCLEDLK